MSISAAKILQARTYILAHPTESKSEQVIGSGLSESTIARARRDLIEEGRLPAPRNAPVKEAPKPKAVADQPAAPAKSPAPATKGMLDHKALLDLAQMIDALVDLGDEDEINRRLSKQALTFALRTDLHPDTRMTASMQYHKLKDQAKAKDLGPGKPKTYALALGRLKDMHQACGVKMVLTSLRESFGTDALLAALKDVFGMEDTADAPSPEAAALVASPSPSAPLQAPGASDHNA